MRRVPSPMRHEIGTTSLSETEVLTCHVHRSTDRCCVVVATETLRDQHRGTDGCVVLERVKHHTNTQQRWLGSQRKSTARPRTVFRALAGSVARSICSARTRTCSKWWREHKYRSASTAFEQLWSSQADLRDTWGAAFAEHQLQFAQHDQSTEPRVACLCWTEFARYTSIETRAYCNCKWILYIQQPY